MKVRGAIPFTDEISLRSLADARALLREHGTADVNLDQFRITYEIAYGEIPEVRPPAWITDAASVLTASPSESQVHHAVSIYLGLYDHWNGIRDELLSLGFEHIPDPEVDPAG